MKKLWISAVMVVTIVLTGCFDTTQELTLQADGSGTLTSTTDMSAAIGMAKQFAGDQQEELEKMVKDTTMMLDKVADSIPNLSEAEKALVKKVSLQINMNMADEKFLTRLVIPFKDNEDMNTITRLSDKVMAEAMKKGMEENKQAGPMGADAPKMSSLEEYFTVEYKKGKIERKLNKEKYATAADDQYLKSMQEAAGMGMPMSSSFIINLPKAAKKVEGSNVTVSDDKKKITIKTDIDDFFDHPEKFEFKVEY